MMGKGVFDFGNISKMFKGNKAIILCIVGLIGIFLIFLSEFVHPGTQTAASQATSSKDSDITAYENQTESRLEQIISQIDGVGRVKVMVTAESGVENVYEQDNKTTTDKSQQKGNDGSTQTQENDNNEQNPTVVNDSTGGQQPLVKVQRQPQILGVVVVCDGGNNPDVKENVVDSVSTALGLETNKINVCQMKTNTSSE